MFTPSRTTSIAPLAGVALLWLLLGACRGSEPESDVRSLVARGEYARALEKAERLARENPDDEKIQATYVQAQVAYLLDCGRQTLFEDDAETALAFFFDAWEIDPGHPSVVTWIRKTRNQLTDEYLDDANDHIASGRLAQAEGAYERALELDPDNWQARLGLGRVLLRLNYREMQSRSYFNDGLRAFQVLLLPEADNAFGKATLYDEDNEDARARREQVRAQMAEDRLATARDLEQNGFFFAARNEYRLVLLIDRDNLEAKAGLDRMDVEAQAETILDEVDMDFRRGDLEGAAKALAQAQILTEAQGEDFGVMAAEIEDARLRQMYQAARDLESDFRYEQAIEAYDQLLAQSDHYEDATARRDYLTEFVERAHQLYARMLEADSDLERLQLLREIELTRPEFEDVPERIRAFEGRARSLYQQALSAEPEDKQAILEEILSFWPDYRDVAEWLRVLQGEAEAETGG